MESLKLRGLALAGSRVTVFYTATELPATLTEGPPLQIAVRGGGDSPSPLKKGAPLSLPIPAPGGPTAFEVGVAASA